MFFKRKRNSKDFEEGYELGILLGEKKGNNDLLETFNDKFGKLDDEDKKRGDKVLKCLMEACNETYSDAERRHNEAVRKMKK